MSKAKLFTRVPTEKDITRYWAKVDRKDSVQLCWPWLAKLSSDGYGYFSFEGRTVQAKRFCWYIHFENPDPDKDVNHLCHGPGCFLGKLCPHRACVNPAHLELISPQENTLKGNGVAGINVRRLFCQSGHQFTETNTGYTKARFRYCKECDRIKSHERWQKMKLDEQIIIQDSQRKLDWDKVSEIHKLHHEGLSTYEIARRFGVRQGTIYNVVAGKTWVTKQLSNYPVSEEVKDRVRTLRAQGYTMDHIAAEVGIACGSVSRILTKEN